MFSIEIIFVIYQLEFSTESKQINNLRTIVMNDDRSRLLLDEIRQAIDQGIYPTLISQGSSGSYFCRSRSRETVAVMKPKNEEPYGHLNPKWTKWLHKTCCPCLFGRSCLIPNVGYVSEAAAYVVDQMLQLGIVPPTTIVHMSSPSFHYSWMDRHIARRTGVFPLKIGSCQVFMRGYEDAGSFLRDGPLKLRSGQLPVDGESGGLDGRVQAQFQDQFERLVVLDYIIRNTDRGLDNWLVKYTPPRSAANTTDVEAAVDSGVDSGTNDEESHDDNNQTAVTADVGEIKIAAIDNGLAFPYKHPDEWRSYPYGWALLPAARVPFSKQTRDRLLPLLSSRQWWLELTASLRKVMSQDPDFDEVMFRRQIAVMKGQVYNLVQVLAGTRGPVEAASTGRPTVATKDPNVSGSSTGTTTDRLLVPDNCEGSPIDLVSKPPCLVWEDDDVRYLTHGFFGRHEFSDGMFGTIIGGIEAFTQKHFSRHAADQMHEPLPSPAPSSASPEPPHLTYAYSVKTKDGRKIIEEVIEEGREELPQDIGSFLAPQVHSPTMATQTAPSASGRRKKAAHAFDAFKGRLITFVKSQPYFREW